MATLNELQKYFDVDLSELANKTESDIDTYIEQNHFGDMLLEQNHHENERYNLWFSLDENVDLGEKRVQIEYSGKKNNHCWETIFEL